MPDDAFAFVEGDVQPLSEARVPIVDRGFLLGDGVFETLRAYKGTPFRWDLHRDRLANGVRALGIRTAVLDEADEAVEELAGAAASDHAYLRIQVTRDPAVREPEDADGVVTGISRPLVPYPQRVYKEGVVVAPVSWRKDPEDPLARVKHLSYLPYLMARREARAAGADDALIRNTAGRFCEASHSNLLAVRGSAVFAPGTDEGALDGVTRRVLLETVEAEGHSVVGALTETNLSSADELMLLNTVGGAVPVDEVKGVSTRLAGARGGLFATLRDAYEELVTTSS